MRNFENAKRIVVKIGTNMLTKEGGWAACSLREVQACILSMIQKKSKVKVQNVKPKRKIEKFWILRYVFSFKF